jgi:hypothetical protein
MRVRFQADADLDGRMIRGLRRVAPRSTFALLATPVLRVWGDLEVLRIAADSGRILVSQGRGTMPAHFARFTSYGQSTQLPTHEPVFGI